MNFANTKLRGKKVSTPDTRPVSLRPEWQPWEEQIIRQATSGIGGGVDFGDLSEISREAESELTEKARRHVTSLIGIIAITLPILTGCARPSEASELTTRANPAQILEGEMSSQGGVFSSPNKPVEAAGPKPPKHTATPTPTPTPSGIPPEIKRFEATHFKDHVEASVTFSDDNPLQVRFFSGREGDREKLVCPPILIEPFLENPGKPEEETFRSCPIPKDSITDNEVGVTIFDADGNETSTTTPVLYRLLLPLISRLGFE